MLQNSYISDKQRKEYQQKNCMKIAQYRIIRKNIYVWYNDFGLPYPHSSENNFRDSWFHYRKLYREHSLFEIIVQEANLDEHLQRAEKDSVVFFFQRICELLQFWYFIGRDNSFAAEKMGNFERAFLLYDGSEQNPNEWVVLLKREYEQDLCSFSNACISVAISKILTDEFEIQLQKLLHEIKNAVLSVRMKGASIYRVDEPGEYYKYFEAYYKNLVDFCNKYRIKNLIGMTEIIQEVWNPDE